VRMGRSLQIRATGSGSCAGVRSTVMKYADCPTTETSIEINASAREVWAAVCDISVPVRFSDELQHAEWLDDATQATLGARFRGRNRHPVVGEWETVSTVTAFEPEHLFEWSVGDPAHPSSKWRFVLSPTDGGGVRLTQWLQIGPARSGLNPAIDAMPDKEERIITRRLDQHRANMTANLAGIKAILEAHPAT
jgi:Polyketide cyclase / dehydrase and lipid transport